MILTRRSLPTECELIARYFAPLARAFPGAYGLLDDAAVISLAAGNELVVKTDTIVGGVDFPPDEPANLVARKALRVNLSDLAAKGATPRAYLVDLVLPDTVDEAWIAAFAAGLSHDQAEYGIHLVGDAALGLSLLGSAPRSLDEASAEFLVDRYRLPQPRVVLGPHLIGIATASLDISDGLVADLRHICSVSRLSAVIEANSIPLSYATRTAIGSDSQHLVTALTGGDDYEILFTASPAAVTRIRELSRSFRTSITPIGRMTLLSGDGQSEVAVLDDSGRALRFASEGWTHFSR